MTLNFLGYGSYQFNIGQNINAAVSQSSVSRALRDVSDILNLPDIMRRYIRFPATLGEMQRIRNQYDKFKLYAIIIM